MGWDRTIDVLRDPMQHQFLLSVDRRLDLGHWNTSGRLFRP